MHSKKEDALYARLFKDGEKVKCGIVDCGADVAKRRLAHPGVYVQGWHNLPPDLAGVFVLEFLPGFTPQKDTQGRKWHLTERIRNRLWFGKEPQTRWDNFNKRKHLKDMAKKFDAHLKAGGREEDFPIMLQPMGTPKPVSLPCLVVCPNCGWPQVLDANVLDVLPEAVGHF